jgi:hypothetical protein
MLKLNGKTHHTEQKHIVMITLMFYFLDYECPEPTSILHASYVRTGTDNYVITINIIDSIGFLSSQMCAHHNITRQLSTWKKRYLCDLSSMLN